MQTLLIVGQKEMLPEQKKVQNLDSNEKCMNELNLSSAVSNFVAVSTWTQSLSVEMAHIAVELGTIV